MDTIQIFEKLYVTKDFQAIVKELENNSDRESLFLLGKIYFEQRDINTAMKYFEKAQAYCELAKCKFFKKDIRSARHLLEKVTNSNWEKEWLSFLIDVVEEKVKLLPTFFQVRNFLEVDLSLLLDYDNIEYAEKIINASEYFVQANAESNKFFARVLYNYNYIGLAKLFLDKSLEVYYKDPETHFITAQCYLAEDNKEMAKKSLYNCLECCEDYFPAKKLLNEIR